MMSSPKYLVLGKEKKMEVTLRKANSLSQSLLEAARSLSLTKTISISIYSATTVESEVATAQAKLTANAEKAVALTKAAYAIRGAIGVINAQSGIDALLTEKAALDATEKLLGGIGGTVAARDIYSEEVTDTTVTVAQARLDALRLRSTDAAARSYGNSDAVSVNIVSDAITADIQEQLTAIRRRKVAIADELLVLNMSTKVALAAPTVALLTEFKLV
jgi:hypothetical protein